MPRTWAPAPALALGLLVALAVLFFWRITLLGEVVYWGTPLLQFSPWRQLAVTLYREGQLPLWNPYVDFGAPLAANFQTAAFSPLNLFYLVLPVEQAMGATIVLHVVLAGALMYGCAVALGLTSWGALLAALAYMFSGYVIARAGFLSIVATVPWLPAVVAGTELVLRAQAKGSARTLPALGLTLATGLLLVAGHIQLAFYTLLVAASYGLVRALQLLRAEGTGGIAEVGQRSPQSAARGLQLVRLLLPVAGATVLGVGLAGVQLLPGAELAAHSARQAGPGYDVALRYSLWPAQLVQLLAPDFYGNPASGDYRGPGNYWEGMAHFGVAPLLLALLAVCHGRHPARRYLLVLALVGLVFALGRFSPVYPWVFTHVPGFGLFQAPARFLLWWTFAGALLAGIGLDTLLARPDLPAIRRWATVTLAGAVGLGTGAAVALAVIGDGSVVAAASLGSMVRAALLLLGTAVLLLLARHRLRGQASFAGFHPAALKGGPAVHGGSLPHFMPDRALRRSWWPAAVCGLVVVDLFSFGMRLNPTTQRTLYTAPWPPAVEQLRAQAGLERLYTPEQTFERRFGQRLGFQDFGPTQWEDLMPLRATLMPNLGQAAGLHEVFNYDPLKLERSRLLRALVDAAPEPAPLLALMGVRWVVNQDGIPTLAPQEPFPRAYRIDQAGMVAVSDRAAALALLQEGRVDLRRQVVLEGGPATAVPGPRPASSGPGQATITAYGAHRVVVQTTGEGPGVLVLTDSFYPGWRATVDGQPAAVYAAHVAFRGVPVPAGEHTVVFEYAPRSLALGLGMSALSLASVVGLGCWALFRRRELSPPRPRSEAELGA
ncbi:MAG: YfhO family protein [Chloroflexi bacterium]|nr:YfhO family protein [Chloroflexota bacterium]